ncbi:MAG: serine/threonine-protein phosphatase [Planctomycetaceae bacterium]|nr:serine/threonine-protein phosphatase [Planctomycetaceae bacterium]
MYDPQRRVSSRKTDRSESHFGHATIPYSSPGDWVSRHPRNRSPHHTGSCHSMSLADTQPELPRFRLMAPANPPKGFIVRSFGLTDLGQVRQSNEDHFAIMELARTMHVHGTNIHQAQAQYSHHRGHIFIVADGMGGHSAGEVASALTVMTIEGFLLNTLNRFTNLQASEEHGVMEEFQNAVLQADAKVFEEAAQHPELLGMGTTLTMAFAVEWKLFVAHAGDSRAYLFSKNELHQLTQDHTVVAEMVRQGVLSPNEALRHPSRHVVTNILGGVEPGVRVELHRLNLEPDDLLLMCSDGLTEMVTDDRIVAIIREDRDPQRVCERLVAEANANGGKDNVTVVVATFHDSAKID